MKKSIIVFVEIVMIFLLASLILIAAEFILYLFILEPLKINKETYHAWHMNDVVVIYSYVQSYFLTRWLSNKFFHQKNNSV